jgi:hypothetical protein
MLSGAISFEGLQPISRQGRQISQTRRSIQPIKTNLGLPGETRELPDMPTGCKPFGTPVPEADDHHPTLHQFTSYVNGNWRRLVRIHRYCDPRSRRSFAQ